MNLWLALFFPNLFSVEPKIDKWKQRKSIDESRDGKRYIETRFFAEGQGVKANREREHCPILAGPVFWNN